MRLTDFFGERNYWKIPLRLIVTKALSEGLIIIITRLVSEPIRPQFYVDDKVRIFLPDQRRNVAREDFWSILTYSFFRSFYIVQEDS